MRKKIYSFKQCEGGHHCVIVLTVKTTRQIEIYTKEKAIPRLKLNINKPLNKLSSPLDARFIPVTISESISLRNLFSEMSINT